MSLFDNIDVIVDKMHKDLVVTKDSRTPAEKLWDKMDRSVLNDNYKSDDLSGLNIPIDAWLVYRDMPVSNLDVFGTLIGRNAPAGYFAVFKIVNDKLICYLRKK